MKLTVKHILNGKAKPANFDPERHNKSAEMRRTMRTGLVLLMLKGRAGRLGEAEWVRRNTI